MSEAIAQRLRQLMEEARATGTKVSAKSLSLAVGGGETYVGDILRGRVRNPSMSKLVRIAKQLKVPLGRLVPDDEPVYQDLQEPAPAYQGPNAAEGRDVQTAAEGRDVRTAAEGRDLRTAAEDRDAVRPLLDPASLTVILAALPHALKRIPEPPSATRTSEAIYRAQGWILDEVAAGRDPSPDTVINFLSHIL